MLTLYILAGCVALAVVLFIVMGSVAALRRPRLPEVVAFEPPPPPSRAFSPRSALPQSASIVALQPLPSSRAETSERDHVPRTVIPLPPIAGIAPATRARTNPAVAHAYASVAAVQSAAATPVQAVWASPPSPSVAQAAWASPPSPPGVQASPPPSVTMPARVAALMPPHVEPAPLPARMPRATKPPPAPQLAPDASKPAVAMEPVAPAPEPAVAIAPAARPPGPDTAMVWAPPPRAIAWAPPETSRDARPEPPLRRSEHTLPRYRERPGALRTVIGWTVATLLVAAAPAVVEPSLLDPLCEDYEWDGAEAAAIVRDYAREANVAVDLDLDLELERLVIDSPAPAN